MNPILVTGYVNPDLDGIAGITAYAEFLNKTGRNAVAGIFGQPHDEAKFLIERFELTFPRQFKNTDNFDEIVLVDASDLIGLEGNVPPQKVLEIIDHRTINESDKFPNAKVQIELVGAAATLVAERFMQKKLGVSRSSAILLCGAIISNTLNFKNSVTTERDHQAFVYLNKTAKLPAVFWREIFAVKSDLTGNKLAQRMRDDFAWFVLCDQKVGIAQIEQLNAEKLLTERFEEITNILREQKARLSLDYIFLNILDLENYQSVLFATEPDTKSLLEETLGAKFSGNIAERPLLMRKQIVPLLKTTLSIPQNLS